MAKKKGRKTTVVQPKKTDKIWTLLPAIFIGAMLLLFLFSMLGDGFYLSLIGLRSWMVILMILALGWVFADELRKGLKGIKNEDLSKNQKILDWVKIGVCVVLVVCFVTIKNGGYTDISGSEDMPFATLKTYGGADCQYTQQIHGNKLNTCKQWSDWTSPENVQWNEQARVIDSAGDEFSGNYLVDYHRTSGSGVAKGLVSEYYRKASHKSDFEQYPLEVAGVDYIAAYTEDGLYDTVLIRKGDVVVRAQFLSNYDTQPSVEQWASVLADSIG